MLLKPRTPGDSYHNLQCKPQLIIPEQKMLNDHVGFFTQGLQNSFAPCANDLASLGIPAFMVTPNASASCSMKYAVFRAKPHEVAVEHHKIGARPAFRLNYVAGTDTAS
jgi:hypothetical protein